MRPPVTTISHADLRQMARDKMPLDTIPDDATVVIVSEAWERHPMVNVACVFVRTISGTYVRVDVDAS